jgi:hypothetical protein
MMPRHQDGRTLRGRLAALVVPVLLLAAACDLIAGLERKDLPGSDASTDLSIDDADAEMTDEHLVGYWRFDEGSGDSARDSSGHANHGNLLNGAAREASDCHRGSCVRFDGFNGHIAVPLSSSLNLTGNQMAISFWMKPLGVNRDGAGQQWQHVIDNYSSYYIDLLGEDEGNRNMSFRVKNTAGTLAVADGATQTTAGEWYHVVGVLRPAEAVIYLNGVRDGQVAFTGNLAASGNESLLFGKYQASFTFNFFGIMDEVKIYDRALTDAEIRDAYLAD